MVKVQVAEDCGDTPKKQLVKDFNIAFAESNTEKILDIMTGDATWTLVGDNTYQGKDNIRVALEKMQIAEAKELKIDNIISNGNRCVANGTMVFADGVIGFCDLYVFDSYARDAKIKKLVSYGVDLESKGA